jgi:aspartyl-tRNA(Asn)/glutamyl-tRNA(Gln) amidotransferase subunit C
MPISRETVEYVAHLSRIELEGAEAKKLSSQLQDILAFIDKLAAAGTVNTAPTCHILPINNIFREDAAKAQLSREEALKNAPASKDGFFRVPKIIE